MDYFLSGFVVFHYLFSPGSTLNTSLPFLGLYLLLLFFFSILVTWMGLQCVEFFCHCCHSCALIFPILGLFNFSWRDGKSVRGLLWKSVFWFNDGGVA